MDHWFGPFCDLLTTFHCLSGSVARLPHASIWLYKARGNCPRHRPALGELLFLLWSYKVRDIFPLYHLWQVCWVLWPPLSIHKQLSWVQKSQLLSVLYLPLHAVPSGNLNWNSAPLYWNLQGNRLQMRLYWFLNNSQYHIDYAPPTNFSFPMGVVMWHTVQEAKEVDPAVDTSARLFRSML